MFAEFFSSLSSRFWQVSAVLSYKDMKIRQNWVLKKEFPDHATVEVFYSKTEFTDYTVSAQDLHLRSRDQKWL